MFEEEKNDMMNEMMKDVEIRKPDKYDKGIAYLTENPEEIYEAWSDPDAWEGRGGELFGFVGPNWRSNSNIYNVRGEVNGTCGCLQQIRLAYINEEAQTMFDLEDKSMTLSHWPRQWARIAMDRRIPADASDIGVEDLPVFAEWQRKIDELRKADGIEVK